LWIFGNSAGSSPSGFKKGVLNKGSDSLKLQDQIRLEPSISSHPGECTADITSLESASGRVTVPGSPLLPRCAPASSFAAAALEGPGQLLSDLACPAIDIESESA
jgi:hypothetical protein